MRNKPPGISHFGPSWASRVPQLRLRHLLARPPGYGVRWMFWLVGQVGLFIVEMVWFVIRMVLVFFLSIAEAILG